MSISYRKHGSTWEYRIRYRDPITQKYKEKAKRGFKSKPQARYAAQDHEKKILEGYDETDLSLVDYLNVWLEEYKKGTIRKNTFILHKRNINNHIAPYFKYIKLKDIKHIMYQKFLNTLSEEYSRRTIEIIHSTMFNAMEKAVTLQKIEKNPCVGATVKGMKSEKKIKFIESSDISIFLQESYKYDYIYWIFFKVLIQTGMRKGEAAALQWNDIDLKEGFININKTLDFDANNNSELFGDPKTFTSKRVITISKGLINDLHFHKKYQNQNKIALNEVYQHDLNLVLSRNDGNYMPKSTLFNAFRRILKRSDLPSLPIHSLRHTHAVLLLESGADMKYVQERLGHGSIQITSDVYAHISKKIEQENMNKFEEYTQNIF